jgi:hypothetical protein
MLEPWNPERNQPKHWNLGIVEGTQENTGTLKRWKEPAKILKG